MKAVRLIRPGQPLEMQQLPVPAMGSRDVLVRVKAAGVCHSDAHYRSGVSPVRPLPLTLGHEVAGVVESVGEEVTNLQIGDRVCLHYMVTCGDCLYCNMGSEQFCTSGVMLGKYRNGGYAEYVSVPARSAFRLPEEIPFEQGAIMMCSSATSYHALRKGRLKAGETVAVYGVGGLGMSAVQLARAFGALDVYAVDIVPSKLALAERFGAIPINARQVDPVAQIKLHSAGRGVDVAVELIGLPMAVRQAVESLAIFGRAVAVGLSDQAVTFSVYQDLMLKEAQLIGSSDHLASELPHLIEMARRGVLDLSEVVTGTLPLDAAAINEAMDRLESNGEDVRMVIQP
jgi:2-desacetyl-2-hydroxyethyl bacteriochlorophyllide A dehydrogenase